MPGAPSRLLMTTAISASAMRPVAMLSAMASKFDPRPDSIRSYLSRRDVRTPSDQLKVMLDSYHDRRTGYEFAVNPAGVKRDYSMDNDGNEDESWDGVWDVATRIDEQGWTAEFRIPFSQLRFPPERSLTFGFGIWRDIARTNVRVSWPVYRRTKPGLSSQLGEVSGIENVAAPRRIEVTPYAVQKDLTLARANGTFMPASAFSNAKLVISVPATPAIFSLAARCVTIAYSSWSPS